MASSPVHISAAGLLWKSASGGTLPHGAVAGGYSGEFELMYVARVLAPDGKYHPAKTVESMDKAHYYYNGQEMTSSTYDVLVRTADNVGLAWLKASDGKIPAYAVQGELNDLYIGHHPVRMPETIFSAIVIGEVNIAEGKCIVVAGNKVFKYSEYKVLCATRPHPINIPTIDPTDGVIT